MTVPDYKLVTYQSSNGPRAGLLIDDHIVDIANATENSSFTTISGLLDSWETARPQLAQLAAHPPARTIAFSESLLLAPIPRPATIYAAGANYRDHVEEMARGQGRDPEPDPHTLGLKAWHFIKASGSVTGPNSDITLPADSKKVDWEIELAAIIGKRSKDVPVELALDAVAGYTIANDLSCRDLARRVGMPENSPFYLDWLAHKSWDGSCPLGPWIVLAANVPDPQNLALKLSINGVVKQDSNTCEMIFTIAEQIALLSSRMTLYPGDVILTGTPAGVGAGRNEFLMPGDELTLWCERIGTLKHRMVK